MFLFRHKTRKGNFQRVFWAIVVMEIVGVIAWLVLSQEAILRATKQVE